MKIVSSIFPTSEISLLIIGFVSCFFLFLILWLLRKLIFKKRYQNFSVASSLSDFKEIGELAVYRAMSSKVVSSTDHAWGEAGKKWWDWLLTEKKIILVVSFDIEFFYDLRSKNFRVSEEDDHFVFQMPVLDFKIGLTDLNIYDEQDSKVLPCLLPGVINNFGGSFSTEDKNKLIKNCTSLANQEAGELIKNISPEVEKSAKKTLTSLSKSLGADKVRFKFLDLPEKPKTNVVNKLEESKSSLV